MGVQGEEEALHEGSKGWKEGKEVSASLRAQLASWRDVLFPRRMCAGKKRYATRLFAMRILRVRQPMQAERLYVYQCPECRGWHLTRMEQAA